MADPRTTRLLLWCGAAGAPLFVVVFLLAGATRANYDPWRTYVSQLSIGDQGWVQTANFVVTGLLMVAFAIGTRRALRSGRGATWGPLLLRAFGLGLVVVGLFVTDPALGYPPGAPVGLTQDLTPTGTVHVAAALFVFGGLAAACVVIGRRFAADPAWGGWARYSYLTAALVLGFLFAANVAAMSAGAPAGLLQRLSVISGFTWITLVATRLARVQST